MPTFGNNLSKKHHILDPAVERGYCYHCSLDRRAKMPTGIFTPRRKVV